MTRRFTRKLYSGRSFECNKKRNPNIDPYNSASHCVDAQITRLFSPLILSRKNLKKNRRRRYIRETGKKFAISCVISSRVQKVTKLSETTRRRRRKRRFAEGWNDERWGMGGIRRDGRRKKPCFRTAELKAV